MAKYENYPIDDSYKIEILPHEFNLNLSSKEQELVETTWKLEKTKRPNIFNGPILNVLEFDRKRVIGFYVEYKYLIAQFRNPELKKNLNIHPVCISGVTFSGNKILFGKRSWNVTQSVNAFELVPSGGVDTHGLKEGEVEILKQFQQELEEEAGLKEIQSCRCFELVYSPDDSLFDICAEIQLKRSASKQLPKQNSEYSEFVWVDKSELSQFCNNPARTFVPLSLWMLHNLKLL